MKQYLVAREIYKDWREFMKKIIITILLLISLNSFSFELGPISTYNLTGWSGDLGYGFQVAAGTGSPTYVWRQYGEDVNFIISNVSLFEFGSDRGNSDQRGLYLEGTPVHVRAPNGMSIRVFNERIRQVDGPPLERLSVKREGNNLGGMVVLGKIDGGRRMQAARISSDLEIGIPWNVPNGKYSFSTEVSGNYRVYSIPSGSYWPSSVNFRGKENKFELITYLKVTIDNAINFGKVIFTSGARERTKRGDINILGGQGSRGRIEIVEPKVFLKKVGGDRDTVPVFIKLIDGGTMGEGIDFKLDDSGRKNLNYEVRLEPGLYPDIPEGRYSGVARFEVKYYN